jgi:two-component system chemotaxis sensor kinase CheA
MQIGNEYSKEVVKIFNQEVAHTSITTLLYPSDKEEQEFLEKTLQDILVGDELMQETLISLLQNEFIINNRYIQVEYKVLDKHNFMMILTDITNLKEQEQKTKDEHQLMKMIVEIATSKEQFLEIKQDYEKVVSQIDNFKTLENLPALRREIHTYKGNFAQKEMLNIVKKLHDFETSIDNSIKQKKINKDILNITTKDMNDWLNLDIDLIKNILGEEYFDKKNDILINKDRIEHLYQKSLQNIDISEELKRLKYNNIKMYFRPYEKLVEQLSLRLDKLVHPLIVNSEDIYVDNKYVPFFNSLVHIFRNSIDHGIEDLETRYELGKDEYGTITCDIKIIDSNLIIDISDDGAGIDINKIKSLAISKGIYTQDEANNLSQKEILMIIFKDEFSTSEIVTDISGRGVGLASIITELEKLDGSLDIHNDFGNGIKFSFSMAIV